MVRQQRAARYTERNSLRHLDEGPAVDAQPARAEDVQVERHRRAVAVAFDVARAAQRLPALQPDVGHLLAGPRVRRDAVAADLEDLALLALPRAREPGRRRLPGRGPGASAG